MDIGDTRILSISNNCKYRHYQCWIREELSISRIAYFTFDHDRHMFSSRFSRQESGQKDMIQWSIICLK